MRPRRPTVRRNLEQVLHCVREALSVVENEEPSSQAVEDLEHASELVKAVVRRLKGEDDDGEDER